MHKILVLAEVGFFGFLLFASPVDAGFPGFRSQEHLDELFDVELKLYNAVTLHNLIPSAEVPSPLTFQDPADATRQETVDFSGNKYIFGFIRYKRADDVWRLAKVTFSIKSPNHYNLTANLQPITIQGVSDRKTYFLIPLNGVGSVMPDRDVVLKVQILKATGIPR